MGLIGAAAGFLLENAGAIGALAGAGTAAYTAANAPKPPKPKTPGAPPTPSEGSDLPGQRAKRYRGPAQVFTEDFRLGQRGTLGGGIV